MIDPNKKPRIQRGFFSPSVFRRRRFQDWSRTCIRVPPVLRNFCLVTKVISYPQPVIEVTNLALTLVLNSKVPSLNGSVSACSAHFVCHFGRREFREGGTMAGLDREQLEALRRQVEEDYKLDVAAIERFQRRFKHHPQSAVQCQNPCRIYRTSAPWPTSVVDRCR